MTVRSGSNQRQRTKQVAVRLSPGEHQIVTLAAATASLTIPAYLRRAALRAALRDAAAELTEALR